jgi:hypothetical protein
MSSRLVIVGSVLTLSLIGGDVRAQEISQSKAEPPRVNPSPLDVPAPTRPLEIPGDVEGRQADAASVTDTGPPEEALFSANLLLGMETGIRGELALFRGARHCYVIEGFYGYVLSNLGTAETGGVGGRAVFRRCSATGENSYLMGAGVDAFAQIKSDGAVLVAPNLDIAWLHDKGSGAGWETGLNLGAGIGVAGHKNGNDGRPVHGMVTPLISFYTGLRF